MVLKAIKLLEDISRSSSLVLRNDAVHNVRKKLKECCDIIEDMCDSKNIQVSRLCDSIIQAVKKVPPDQKKSLEVFIEPVVMMFWSTVNHPKTNRRILKLLLQLEQSFPSQVLMQLQTCSTMINISSTKQQLAAWSALIAQSAVGCSLVASEIATVLSVITDQLSIFTETNDSVWTVPRQEHLHSLVKLILELLQQLPSEVNLTLAGQHTSHTNGQDQTQLLLGQSIIQQLTYVLLLESSPKDCCLIGGTALMSLICSQRENKEQMCHEAVTLFNTIGCADTMTIGPWQINACGRRQDPTASGATSDSSNNKNLTFTRLAIVSGILASADLDALLVQVPDDTCDLAVWILNTLCGLCLAPECQYQAFRQLVQWYQRVGKSCGDLLRRRGLRRFFHPSGVVVCRTLEIVWTHLDSAVDGVTDSVVDILKSLLLLESKEAKLYQELTTQSGNADNSPKIMSGSLGDGDDLPKGRLESAPRGADPPCGGGARRSRPEPVSAGGDGCVSGVVARSLPHELLASVTKMSWQAKGKYSVMAAVMPYVDIMEILSLEPSPFEDLLRCLETNYLTPVASDLYVAIVEQVRSKPFEVMKEKCLPWVLMAMTSSNSLVRQNASHHWLPVTFKLIPASLAELQRQLTDTLEMTAEQNQTLHGYIATLKAARHSQLPVKWEKDILSKALVNPDGNIRLEAFTFLCVSPKKAETPTVEEFGLLVAHLPDNLNIDEPPFRPQLQGNLRHALTRARDGALKADTKSLREGERQSLREVQDTIAFIDWLWCLCMEGLHPGSNYQRMKTCLDWAWVVMDTVTPVTDRRKGGCPETITRLISAARDVNKWEFFTSDSASRLLTCLLHNTDEVRDQASSLLQRFFPWPLPLGSGSPDVCAEHPSALCDIWSEALRLCNSPRTRACESGAGIARLVFLKHVAELGDELELTMVSNQVTVRVTGRGGEPEAMAVSFLTQLVQLVEVSARNAHQDVLSAARNSPAHGFLTLIFLVLPDCSKLIKSPDLWRPLVKKLIAVATDLLMLVMDVFGGRLHSEECAPSFEQINLAIQQAIAQAGPDEEAGPENTNLSPEHQMINTWCWLNIREASKLLSHVVQTATLESLEPNVLLETSDVIAVSDTFFHVLTKCRHKGAIEGCNIGFLHLCRHLISHKDPQLFHVPRHILQKVLDQLSVLSKSSVTRRSAGLPLIVQSILANEGKTRQTILLSHAMERLLATANQPAPSNPDQQQDLPQVHALNILKAVFRESVVSQTVLPYIAMATKTAIEGFASPFWALRNASTQLFGTLQSRMLGQKKTRDDSLHTTTTTEFFTLYPTLLEYALDHVARAAAEQGAGRLALHPSLFPVLSILGKLSPGAANDQGEGILDQFRKPVQFLAQSPIYAVRMLSAEAMASLVLRHRSCDVMHELVRQLPAGRSPGTSFNLLHGQLLQLEKLVEAHRPSRETSQSLLEALAASAWLLGADNPCPLVQAKYLSVALRLSDALPGAMTLALCGAAEGLLLPGIPADGPGSVGIGSWASAGPLAAWWLGEAAKQGTKPGSNQGTGLTLEMRLESCLTSESPDVRLASLSYLCSDAAQTLLEPTAWRHIQGIVLSRIPTGLGWEELCASLQLVLDIYDRHHLCAVQRQGHGEGQGRALWEFLLTLIEREVNGRPAALALAVSAVLVTTMATCEGCNWSPWVRLLELCSAPGRADLPRYHTAKALYIAGRPLVEQLVTSGENEQLKLGLRMVHTTLELLMDEQTDTRNMAAAFVRTLCGDIEHPEMHYNMAIMRLFDYVSMRVSASLPVMQWVVASFRQSSQSVSDVINLARDDRMDEMFEASETNPYKEQFMLNEYLVNFATRIPAGDDVANDVTKRWLKEALRNARSQLDAAAQLLREDKGVLTVTCQKRVYEGLQGLLSEVGVLVHWTRLTGSDVTDSGLPRDVMLQLQHSSIHCGLKKLIGEILVR